MDKYKNDLQEIEKCSQTLKHLVMEKQKIFQHVQQYGDDKNQLSTKIQEYQIYYDHIFEKRRQIVNKIEEELNETITYLYPFGTQTPTIRMGKIFQVKENGDISCELRYESNSLFDASFKPVI